MPSSVSILTIKKMLTNLRNEDRLKWNNKESLVYTSVEQRYCGAWQAGKSRKRNRYKGSRGGLGKVSRGVYVEQRGRGTRTMKARRGCLREEILVGERGGQQVVLVLKRR